MTGFIDRLKRLARASIVPPGPLPDGPMTVSLRCQDVVMFAITDTGAVYQIINAQVTGGALTRLTQPQLSIMRIMDQFGVEDFDPDAFID